MEFEPGIKIRPEVLRFERAKRGLNLRDAAELTGLTKDTLSELERGRRNAWMATLHKISEGYGIAVEELVHESMLPKAEAPSPPKEEGEERRARKIEDAAFWIESLADQGELLEEDIKSSSSSEELPLEHGRTFNCGQLLAQGLFEELASAGQPPRLLQEAMEHLDAVSARIEKLWRQLLRPGAVEIMGEFGQFARRRAEAQRGEESREVGDARGSSAGDAG